MNTTALPFSQEAEEAVIGSVLMNPPVYVQLASFLHADDFYLVRHQHIWRAFERISENNMPIDMLVLVEVLENMGKLDDVGGQAHLIQLASNTPSPYNAEIYGRIVERASIRRRLIMAADDIRKMAMNEDSTLESVLSEAEARLFSVSDIQTRRSFVPMWQALSDYYDRMEQLLSRRGQALGVPSGFRDLDLLLGGFQKSDLLVFAGRPGMGKTSFLLTVALNAARVGARVAIFTMEMGVEQIVQRMVSMESRINVQKLRLANLTPQEGARFTEVIGRLSHLAIYIDDTPALTPLDIRTKARRLYHEQGLDMIIVDYMQLMSGGRGLENNRVQEISYISRSLKELARELNVPLISAAQLSRAVEQRQDKRPLLSDLRESGSIEQDADIVMFLYRDEMYNEATEYPGQADIIVAKHRNGPTGVVSLYFEKELTRFMDVNHHRVDLSDLG